MGISRDSQHKRRLTGGKKPHHHKKRKHEMGRQMAMTKIGVKRVHTVRCRGNNTKFRAMRLDTGGCCASTRVLLHDDGCTPAGRFDALGHSAGGAAACVRLDLHCCLVPAERLRLG